jgi:nitrogen fixation/metabolism regulation signal transduction histidine kinase
VKLLANPIMLRMVLGLIAAGLAFLVGAVIMRRMRRHLSEEASFADAATSDRLPLHTYHAVIQQLKQQKHELQSEQQVERRRAKTSENISAAVLSHLSSGVMFFTPDGLVRQANASARRILGFASPVGVKAAQIFRDATVIPTSGGPEENVADAIQTSLREKAPFLRLAAQYVTPVGEQRTLDITVSAVHAPAGEVLGAACLINDQSEMSRIRRQQELRREMSAEMALGLRNSLSTISGCAKRIVDGQDQELSRRLASDIAAEAAQLDHTIGGFLAGERAAAAAGGT